MIVQKDDAWEEWGLEQLVNNLRKYVERNPLRTSDDDGKRDNTLGHHLGRKERKAAPRKLRRAEDDET